LFPEAQPPTRRGL